MNEADHKGSAKAEPGNDPLDRAMVEMEEPVTALLGASAALRLALAGTVARREDHAFSAWEGEALEYLAAHVQDLAETVAAIHAGRPPAWRVGQPFRAVLRPGEAAA